MSLNSKPGVSNVCVIPSPVGWEPYPQAPFKPNPGVCMVVMDAREEKRGNLHIPANVAGHIKPDTGTVVAVHKEYRLNDGQIGGETDLRVGQRVAVLPYAGTWFRTLQLPGWEGKDVRLYGIVSEDEHCPQFEDDTIVMILEKTFRPRRERVLIYRDKPQDEKSGILLPDTALRGTWKGTVVEVGPDARAEGARPGDRVIYHAPATVIELDFDPSDYGLPGEAERYALIRWSECHGVIEGSVSRSISEDVCTVDPETGRIAETKDRELEILGGVIE